MRGQCIFCKGDLEEQAITYPTQYKGRVIVVTNVPALVCRQCGETVFEPDVAARLQEIVWGKVSGKQRVTVDTYDFVEVA